MKSKKILIFFCVTLFYSFPDQAQNKKEASGKAYLVSDAHFDTQWNWDVQESISKYIPNTLNQNLLLLDKYPHYIFNFEGGIKYQWMKEYYPDQYERMKKYIQQGRWHVAGSTWDATDTNIPSPESFTRNILYGQHFYRKEFGVQGTDIFLPDCFGFGWTLPTLAAHSGLIGFSTQKLQWRQKPFYGESKVPFDIGLWQGVDGSRIMLVANAQDYTTKWNDEDLSTNKNLISQVESSPVKTIYHYYGTGDRGGSPTIESVRSAEKGLQGKGPIQIISATSDQLYKDFQPFDKHPELPVFNGELLMDVHGTGCYTSQAAMKLYNRKNELLADAAERSSVIADWLGAINYPKATMTDTWKRFIWHQFHDDLTGTSIPRAYEFSWNDELISLKQSAAVLKTAVGGISRALDTQVKGIPLVVYNPLSQKVSDILKVSIPLNKKTGLTVFDQQGKEIPSQLLSHRDGKATLLIAASAPALGYAVYDIRTAGNTPGTVLKVNQTSIENAIYWVTLNKNGDISSIVDKRNQKELVKAGKNIRLALFQENESYAWPAWEILKKDIDKIPVSIQDDVRITVAEQGPVRAALCVERTYKGSSFRQYIRLTNGGQDDRIDVYNEIDWQTSGAILKAEFPLNVTNQKATYDLGIGAIERGNNTETAYEVYGQFWADLADSDQSYSVSIMNDCKYGWDKPDNNTLRLTLLHTPNAPYWFQYQSKQDLGRHAFTYSIFGHDNTYQEAKTVLKAEVLNQPLKAFVTDKHKGSLGKSFSFAAIDNENILIKAVKQAEESDEFIIRLYETTGQKKQSAILSFMEDIVSAKQVNGVEDIVQNATFKANQLEISIAPFGIKTYKIRLKDPKSKLTPDLSLPLTLNYNVKTTTYNAFRGEANFDGRGHSLSAELFPATIENEGLRFVLAGGDEKNGLKCQGDTILLPSGGKYDRLRFLATSTQRDQTATFRIDDLSRQFVIPYYTGFIGQWGNPKAVNGYLKSGDIAYLGTHSHSMLGNKDLPYEYTYIYSFSIDLPKNAKYFILPKNSKIVLFAASLTRSENKFIYEATDLLNLGLSDTLVSDNRLLNGKSVFQKSGEVNDREKANFAIDEDSETKWCDAGDAASKFITIDLEKETSIKGWYVMHAGFEAEEYTTKDYSLQIKSEGDSEWKTVDTVVDNKSYETDRLLPTTQKARYVRLLITKADQNGGHIARIYEFNMY